MKTDAEIKLGLELCCQDENVSNGRCPYGRDCEECDGDGIQRLKADALALIERLEEENMCMRIQMRGDCGVCKHQEVEFGFEPCDSCIDKLDHPAWEYEGLPELRRENKR